jgi:hypothetical protein
MQKLVTLLLLFRVANVFAVDTTDSPVGRTYWINDRADDVAPVTLLTAPYGKPIILANRSFVVVELDTNNPRDLAYKIRTDDGQVLYIHRDDFQRALFNEKEYVSEGRGYLTIRQYLFTGPPIAITEEIDRKQGAARRAASAAKQAKDAAFRARLANAEASYQSRLAARIALGGVRVGMTREQARQSSWLTPDKINITTTVQGQQEQWVYPEANFLYFTNGILTGIQNHSDDGVYRRAK